VTFGNYGQFVAKATVTGPLNEAETLAFRLDATTHTN
jgi:iron complex outermembrane receptor protein